VPAGLNDDPGLDGELWTELHIASCFARAHDFDLMHNNPDWKPLLHALATATPPMLTTVHGFSSPQILGAYYAGAVRSFYCSISDADRDPGLSYLAMTYNGIDPGEWTFREAAGDYLLFFGRFHPEKGAHLAIEVARRAGVRLKMAGIPQDAAYFRELVEPHIDGALIAHRRGLEHVVCGSFDDIGFAPSSIAALGLFDVLEHIEDDVEALSRAIVRLVDDASLRTRLGQERDEDRKEPRLALWRAGGRPVSAPAGARCVRS